MSEGCRKASQASRLLVGGNVKRLRRALGYLQRELAEVTGLNRNHIISIERGLENMSLSTVERLAEGLRCSPVTLVAEHSARIVVAYNVRRLREAHGWTQQQLAERVSVVASYVGNVEQGRMNLTLSSVARLAEGLRCSLVTLLGGHQDPVVLSGIVLSLGAVQTHRVIVGNNVMRLREVHGWTRQQLAERLSVAASYIGNVEQGRMNLTLSSMGRLAEGLRCSLATLVDGHRDPAAGSGDSNYSQLRGVALSVIVGDNVKRLREARGWSQQQLAGRLSAAKGFVGNTERGVMNLRLASVEALAEGLQCSLADILQAPFSHPHRRGLDRPRSDCKLVTY
ncbi:MAG: helix-turn-helix domain-containing protein [Steroidobacteraceae bacterium]